MKRFSSAPSLAPDSRAGSILRDGAALATIAVFVAVVAFLAGTAGEIVVQWRIGAMP
jgi:hypothetical protein